MSAQASKIHPLNQPPYLMWLIIILTGITGIAHLFMALTFEVNWDEFFYLDWVYQWGDGRLDLVLQTLFLRAFAWLPSIGGYEVDQIVAGRLVMFVLLCTSSVMLWSISQRYFSARASALALLTFLSFSFVFRHATSFRADMIVTTLCVATLWILTCKRLNWRYLAFGGVLFGLAGMVSIKAVFYAPTIGAVVLITSLMEQSEKTGSVKTALLKLLLIGGVSVLSFIAFYTLHSLTVPNASSGVDYVNQAAGASLIKEGVFPRWDFFAFSVQRNIFHWAILLVGIVILLRQLSQKKTRLNAMICLSFLFPLLTLLFYTHAYAYYYVFMLAPATIIMAAAYDTKFFKAEAVRNIVPLVILTATLFISVQRGNQQSLKTQKQIISVVHSLFPTPTAYIDRCAMIASSPKSGLFMSAWFMENYYEANTPIFLEILRNEQPKYILANIDSLDLDLITEDTKRRLLPEDESVLKENYIHHWGPIYVAGKRIKLNKDQVINTDILIPGTYTLESVSPVRINNALYENRNTVTLTPTNISLLSNSDQEIILKWGNQLAIPRVAAPDKALFNGF